MNNSNFSAEKIAYLNMIESTISRMADNAFKIKGWVISINVALATLFFSQRNSGFKIAIAIIGFASVIIFFMYDNKFLSLEKYYRNLYDTVRLLKDGNINFDLTPKKVDHLTNRENLVLYISMLFLWFIGVVIL